MRGKRALPILGCVVVLAVLNSGCAIKSLREANQRLKESNDRLISENNQLESELARLQSRPRSGGERHEKPAVQQAPAEPVVAMNTSAILPNIPDVTITQDPGGIHIRGENKVFFALGQAKLSKNGQNVLDKVGRSIKRSYGDRQIRVEGHTDDIPVRKIRHLYPSNWELSTARACTVVRYLVDKVGVPPRTIFPAGYSYHRPIDPGKSASARRRNRRVEITILN